MNPKELGAENLRQRDGVSQTARAYAALDPAHAPVDERSLRDLLAFARKYAKELRYVSADDTADQDWAAFFPHDLHLDTVIAYMNDPAQLSAEEALLCRRPHFALFLTFLHLLRHTQAQMNTLTGRHLDYIYRQVLHMRRRAGTPDRVHLLADLAPSSQPFLLPAGSLVDAGTDSRQQPLHYATDQDLLVSPAQVALLRGVYRDTKGSLGLVPIADATLNRVMTPEADEGDTLRWRTFGQLPGLVKADSPPPPAVGWAISSPVLALSQGTRTITLTLQFDPKTFVMDGEEGIKGNENSFQVDVSSAKGWIQPDTSVKVEVGYLADTPGKDGKVPIVDRGGAAAQPAMRFTLTFSPKQPALTSPDPKVSALGSAWPVLRLRLRPVWRPDAKDAGWGRYVCAYGPLQHLVLKEAGLHVDVSGLTAVQLQNDEGSLTPNRPFLPFGSTPVVGSRFYLGFPELATKQVESLTFHPEWMGKPDFAEQYKNYPG